MKVLKKAYYGLRAIVGIAHFGEISAHALAREENLPEEYLQKILQQLKKAGVIVSEKGSTGGYALAKNTRDISIWEIILALDGEIIPFAPPKMTEASTYSTLTHCQANIAWRKLGEAIEGTLSRMSIADLISTNTKIRNSKSQAPNKLQIQKKY